jgi:hypothetical protein
MTTSIFRFTNSRCVAPITAGILALTLFCAKGEMQDSDSDGLSDYDETNTYFTGRIDGEQYLGNTNKK